MGGKMDNFNNSLFFSLAGEETKVLILGGGKAAYIKCSTLALNKFQVHCLAPSFSRDIKELATRYENLKIITDKFQEDMLDNYHLIVICTSDNEFNSSIRDLCRKKNKIFIDTTKPNKSQGMICATRKSKNIAIGIKIKESNPKASVFLCNKGKEYLNKLDDYIEYSTILRNSIKDKELKKSVLNFICSDDFIFIFNKNKAYEVLLMFYPELENVLSAIK